jgi:3-deoxy-D-manno-octulosonate 8-phosphate phosphatase (KDO 8-P phosphatase)
MKTINSGSCDHKKVKLFVMDADGTLTDGKLYISGHGEIFKAFNVKDGHGIHELLPTHRVIPAVITGRKSDILERRCRELNINHLYQDVSDKSGVVRELSRRLSLKLENVAYIGDDDNDLDSMRIVALSGCPADASERVKTESDFIAKRKGGEGAVREFIEWLIQEGYI